MDMNSSSQLSVTGDHDTTTLFVHRFLETPHGAHMLVKIWIPSE